MKDKITVDDLLFHPAHGLCRVTEVSASRGPKEAQYLLLPVKSSHAKIRFIIPASSLLESGFRKLISVKEANAILDYFKTGKSGENGEDGEAWALAATVLTASSSKEMLKDQRKRQLLDQSVKGLAGELAYVLQVTLTEIAEKMQVNLSGHLPINPLVLNALSKVDKD